MGISFCALEIEGIHLHLKDFFYNTAEQEL